MISIICVATTDYAKRWSFCIRSQRRYADSLGYEYILHNGTVAGLHPKWTKIQCVIDALQQGKDVLMIDADAQILKRTPPLRDILNRDGDIFYANGHSDRLNSGVMLFRAGSYSCARTYLQTCLDRRNVPVSGENFVTHEGENGHLIEALKEPEFNRRSTILGREWNCTVPEGVKGAYILHYTSKLRRELDENNIPLANEAKRKGEIVRAFAYRTLRRGRKHLGRLIPRQ